MQAGFNSVVLVVTLVKGVNDNQLGDIINFAVKNFDVVRCINVQPVSLCGRLPQKDREKMRITIPDFMKAVEEQTNGDDKSLRLLPSAHGCSSFKSSRRTKRQKIFRVHSAPALRHGNIPFD